MAESNIEWTDATWNPIGGCSIKSPGCINCYAQRLAGTRLYKHPLYRGVTDYVNGNHVFNGKMTTAAIDHDVWSWPLRWRGSKTPKLGNASLIFVGDMADLFHESRSFGSIMRVWDVAFRSRHIMQFLTKRPDVLLAFIEQWWDVEESDLDPKLARGPDAVRAHHKSGRSRLFADMLDAMGEPPPGAAFPLYDWAAGPRWWPNLPDRAWFGFSAERQQEFDERWPHMKKLAAMGATIFVSYEPALGPLHLPDDFLALKGRAQVIVGGESGDHARGFDPAWARAIQGQCQWSGVAFFFKQMRKRDPIPSDLMVREFPR